MKHIYRILYARPDGSLTSVVSVHAFPQAGAALQQELAEGQHNGWTVLELEFDVYEA